MLRWTMFAARCFVVMVILGAVAAGAYEFFLVANVGRATSQIGGSR